MSRNLYVIIIALTIIIFCSCFLIFYGTNDLFVFPFDSAVWGTASDWVMVLVTISTAIAIWGTLTSQKKVQQSQQIQVELMMDDYLDKIKPEFINPNANDGVVVSSVDIKDNGTISFEVEFYVKNVGKDAYSFRIDGTRVLDFYKITHYKTGMSEMLTTIGITDLNKGGNYAHDFHLYFTDRMQNEYKQAIRVKFNVGQGNYTNSRSIEFAEPVLMKRYFYNENLK